MSKHVGFPSERLVFHITVDKVVSKDTEFGPIGYHTMHTQDGDVLFWTASTHAQWLEVGKSYTVKATVKNHDVDEDGTKRTIVFRVMEYVEPVRVARVAVGLRRFSR